MSRNSPFILVNNFGCANLKSFNKPLGICHKTQHPGPCSPSLTFAQFTVSFLHAYVLFIGVHLNFWVAWFMAHFQLLPQPKPFPWLFVDNIKDWQTLHWHCKLSVWPIPSQSIPLVRYPYPCLYINSSLGSLGITSSLTCWQRSALGFILKCAELLHIVKVEARWTAIQIGVSIDALQVKPQQQEYSFKCQLK